MLRNSVMNLKLSRCWLGEELSSPASNCSRIMTDVQVGARNSVVRKSVNNIGGTVTLTNVNKLKDCLAV